ncbi:hypothetical protein FRACA_3110005 [Frankia canadensis]|uniref:Uncharacterized protein n=1 Tax=Frankia canadensis TaxID=1836972 RepID=A0A2I2KUA9_9ACTN|nr:hypothetical protein FRACA_3110005 [Frankia canadensis]SOU56547.1 hypothetical protein FRACA_3110005 [Frankia canadensis]
MGARPAERGQPSRALRKPGAVDRGHRRSASTSTTPAVYSFSYDQADRLTNSGYAYDLVGRTTTDPYPPAGSSASRLDPQHHRHRRRPRRYPDRHPVGSPYFPSSAYPRYGWLAPNNAAATPRRPHPYGRPPL